jgi:hypothetical protein
MLTLQAIAMTERPVDVVTDVGASRLKAIASGSKRPYFLSQSPYCARADAETCNQLTRQWGDNLSLESAWVSDIDGYYLLGKSAEGYQGAALGNGERKNFKALYQTLGVLGAFAQQFGLPKRSSIRLSILLPISEYATSEKLIQDLKVAVQSFTYCGVANEFKLAGISVKPEGAGVIMRGLPKGTPTQGRVGSLMGGYRNFSRIVMDAGKPDIPSSKTCDLGFSWLVERTMQATGHSKPEWVLRSLLKGFRLLGDRLYDSLNNTKTFNGLGLSAIDQEICEHGLRLLPIYWSQVETWNASLEPVDYLIAAGGTMHELRPLASQQMPDLLWPDAVHTKIMRHEPDASMAFRFVDPFCVYESMEQTRG